ncbi:3-isopropylmalate dehydratase small subunit [Alteromonas sp. ASW11-36]|uniref:3-isopropylmalate dehydratase small subunit n=1 Tax=Alteromonas arenosi TaxID=3055817 RepID=A0ABT7T2G2_9ALTE|nr:3-isopropylmalate dehydratase small subunit [Alteromonas sp. ASW11-36]MDM7861944.1 3-isopropylmalate dehydratase small subunit [Alteromonas sp. ASW11-36]
MSDAGFQHHTGAACPLDQANVDTDQIIPKQFLTGVSREGYGKHLFHDWRYLDQHEQVLNPEFVMNFPQHKHASVLLTRENFGCGSSREHAPWALLDYGFKVVIATSFADIFYGNAINNQLLPIALDNTAMDQLFAAVGNDPSVQIRIDLQSQTVSCAGVTHSFEIDPQHKHNLLLGLDMIGQTLTLDDNITAYEAKRHAWL